MANVNLTTGGVYKEINDLYVTQNGVHRRVSEMYTTQQGVHRQISLSQVNPVFGENSWAEIAAAGRRISAGGSIPTGWKLGDIKVDTATNSRVPKQYQIVGFNIDEVVGENRTAGISLITADISNQIFNFASASMQAPGWTATYGYRSFKGYMEYPGVGISQELYDLLLTVTKYQVYLNASNIYPYEDKIWMPNSFEIGARIPSDGTPYKQYPYFLENPGPDARRKNITTSSIYQSYWLTDVGSRSGASIITNTGAFSSMSYSNSQYFCAGVCLG